MENISNSYKVVLYPKAYHDIEEIYKYITKVLLEPKSAQQQIKRLQEAINSLSSFPYAHQDRLVGRFANQGFKQLLIDNYLVIYIVDEKQKQVNIIIVQYIGRNV